MSPLAITPFQRFVTDQPIRFVGTAPQARRWPGPEGSDLFAFCALCDILHWQILGRCCNWPVSRAL